MKNKTPNELTYGRENACNLVVIRNGTACAPQSEQEALERHEEKLLKDTSGEVK